MRHPGPRLVLAFGIVTGLASGAALALRNPEQVGIATDVYYHAARAFLSGRDVYAVRPPTHPGFGFLYPPVVVLAFVPHALTGSPLGAYALQTAINLLSAAAFARLLVRALERAGVELSRVDHGLIAGYALGGYGTTATLVMGQVNLQLALAIALGALWFESNEDRAGVTFGVATVVKPFLALLGAWFLRCRAWRAILAATATGITALSIGFLLLGPDATVQYFSRVVPREAAAGSFTGRPDPGSPYLTIRRQLAFLAPGLSAAWRSALGALVSASIVLACYRSMATYRDRLIALGGTLLVVLLFVPLEPFYVGLVVFPIVPLLYLLDPGTPRTSLLLGVALLSAPVSMVAIDVWAGFLPTGAGNALRAVARIVFRFVLPPTVGIWLALLGVVLVRRDQSSATAPGR